MLVNISLEFKKKKKHQSDSKGQLVAVRAQTNFLTHLQNLASASKIY